MSLRRSVAEIMVLVLAASFLSGCLFRRHRGEDAGSVNPGDQPDKILYEKAVREIGRGRFDVGRLTLQTLINTYPDSEYLSKSKLAIADSYYSEGGVSGLTQAEAEYKDFITFFPTAPEAPDAQYKAGMAHYRLMAKADRDRTEAKLSEAEFKEFLLKYPDSQTMPRVKRRLREVQEVLAQGDFKIARYYYSKGAMRAAQSRFQEIAESYPDFSRVDSALWHLGQSLERLKKANDAGPFYARIITEHPLSPLVEDAKARLTALHQPIPRPTRAMLARAEADAASRPGKDVFQKMGGFLSSSPDTSATRRGPVRLGAPKPAGVEVAKVPVPTPGASSLVVQPVGEESLKAGKPVNATPPAATAGSTNAASSGAQESTSPPTPAADPSKEASTSAQKVPEGSAASGRQTSDPTPPTKKKKRSLFKRIIKPF